MNHLKVNVVAVSNGHFDVQCECGEVLVRSIAVSLTEIDQAIAAHRVVAVAAERQTRTLSYTGPERRQARPVVAEGQQEAVRPPTPSPARSSLPAAPPPPNPGHTVGVVETELEVRLARLERIVHRMVTNPTTRQASMEEIRDAWREEGEQLRQEKSSIGCRCEGPEHNPDCWKKYS